MPLVRAQSDPRVDHVAALVQVATGSRMNQLIDVAVATPAPPRPSCTCGHPESAHDPIADRYCAATINGGLDRGCICHTVAADTPVAAV